MSLPYIQICRILDGPPIRWMRCVRSDTALRRCWTSGWVCGEDVGLLRNLSRGYGVIG